MKKLKKFAALLLAGVMVMALLTACGGSSEAAQAETSMLSAINSQRSVDSAAPLNNELKREAKDFLNTVVDVKTGVFDTFNSVKISQNEAGVITVKVVVENKYNGNLLKDFLAKINTGSKVDVSTVGKWTKVGVAADTAAGKTYVAVVVEINPYA